MVAGLVLVLVLVLVALQRLHFRVWDRDARDIQMTSVHRLHELVISHGTIKCVAGYCESSTRIGYYTLSPRLYLLSFPIAAFNSFWSCSMK